LEFTGMSVAPTPASAASSPASAKRILRWHGFLGEMRRSPLRAGLVLVLCTAVIVASGWFIVYPQLAVHYRVRKARLAADEHDLVEARRQLDLALRHAPRSGELHFLQARTCRRAGDDVAARQHLRKARDENWDQEDLELEFRLLQALTGTIRKVEKELQSYIGTGHRDEMYVLEALVLAYYSNNILNEAHFWVEYWISQYPDAWRPQYLRGLILERGLKPQKAAEQYEALLGWKPDQPDARLQLARINLRAKMYEQAKGHYEHFLRLRPGSPDGMVGLAGCLRQLQQAESALPILEEVIAGHPRHHPAHLLRGMILLNDLNRHAEAAESLRTADDLAPNDLETVGNLQKAYAALGRTEDAKLYEEKSRLLENAFRRMDKLVKEIIETEQKKGSDPAARRRSVELRHEAGITLLKAGRKDEAINWLMSVLQEDPGHEATLDVLREHAKEANRGASAPGAGQLPPGK
jgi:tetratricopeptide (TPR) repeat protein